MGRRIEPNKYRVYIYKGKKRFLEKDCRSPEKAVEEARSLAGEHEKVYACIEYFPDDAPDDAPAKEYELMTITNGTERHGENSPEKQARAQQQREEAAAAAEARAQAAARPAGQRRTLKEFLFESGPAKEASAEDRVSDARRRANWLAVLCVLILVYFVMQTIQQTLL